MRAWHSEQHPVLPQCRPSKSEICLAHLRRIPHRINSTRIGLRSLLSLDWTLSLSVQGTLTKSLFKKPAICLNECIKALFSWPVVAHFWHNRDKFVTTKNDASQPRSTLKTFSCSANFIPCIFVFRHHTLLRTDFKTRFY